jgi:hypothetical protein
LCGSVILIFAFSDFGSLQHEQVVLFEELQLEFFPFDGPILYFVEIIELHNIHVIFFGSANKGSFTCQVKKSSPWNVESFPVGHILITKAI